MTLGVAYHSGADDSGADDSGADEIIFDESVLDNSFAAFKKDITETRCVVERLGKFPGYGERIHGGGAVLVDDEANATYDCLLPHMITSYSKSELPSASAYATWERFSLQPYASRPHGRRYAVNYANEIAAESYGLYEDAGTMPVGAVLAKDSFTVTQSGRAVYGSLALMEKMRPGFNPQTGDWRYAMVLPDGRLLGMTKTNSADAVTFCAECHAEVAAQDYLFFMPQEVRR